MIDENQIKEADIITAILRNNYDFILDVFSDPNMPLEIKEGQPMHHLRAIDIPIHSADELFQLRQTVRKLRGEEGMATKEDRQDELVAMWMHDKEKLVAWHKLWTNMDIKERSDIAGKRMIGQILELEFPGEN